MLYYVTRNLLWECGIRPKCRIGRSKANLELTAGKYYFESCGMASYNTTTTLEGCTDWFEGYSQMNADAEATTSCMGNFYCGDSPLTITVPENNKLIIYCWK